MIPLHNFLILLGFFLSILHLALIFSIVRRIYKHRKLLATYTLYDLLQLIAISVHFLIMSWLEGTMFLSGDLTNATSICVFLLVYAAFYAFYLLCFSSMESSKFKYRGKRRRRYSEEVPEVTKVIEIPAVPAKGLTPQSNRFIQKRHCRLRSRQKKDY